MTLFDKQVSRKPNLYPWTKDFQKAMWNGFWTAEKFSFDSDYSDYFKLLSEEEREIVKKTLAAIAQIEVEVKRFWARLGDHLPHPGIGSLGITMAGVEEIHNDAYEKLIERLGLDSIFEENLNVPAIAGRVGYLNKHNSKVYGKDQRKQFVYSLILFTLFVENVSLFSQFYIILNFNRFKNVLKDTSNQVKYTRNEELLHAQAGMKIINTLRAELPELFDEELESRILDACKAAYDAEANLIDWILGEYKSEKLDAPLLKSYVAGRLNESLEGIGYKAVFEVSEDDERETFWMTEGLLAPPVHDFFHSDGVGYQTSDQPEDDEF